MRTLPLKIVTSLTLLSLLVACGKDDSSSSSSSGGTGSTPQEEEIQLEVNADGSNIDGIYMAKFETLNPQVNGTLPGSASINRKGDKIFAYVRLFAGGPEVWHPQSIYTGKRCPTMDDDTNKDGFIDINEANAVLGKVIVPLDADISSQKSGRNFYPLGDLSGNYFYERVGSFNRFWSDLKREDTDPDDNFVKLGPEDGLPIIGQAFLLQGIVQTTELPETVGTIGRYLPQQTLPIACGIFRKVEEEPGQADDGVIPGPIAEVEEGQDRPAPEGEGEVEGDGIPRTGGSNETDSDTSTSDDGGIEDTGPTTGGTTTGGTTTGGTTTGGTTTGGTTTGGSSSGGSTTGGSSTGGSTTGGTVEEETPPTQPAPEDTNSEEEDSTPEIEAETEPEAEPETETETETQE